MRRSILTVIMYVAFVGVFAIVLAVPALAKDKPDCAARAVTDSWFK